MHGTPEARAAVSNLILSLEFSRFRILGSHLDTPHLLRATIITHGSTLQQALYPSSAIDMVLELDIPPCISKPAHPLHPPSLDRPLRIEIQGDLCLLPDVKRPVDNDVSTWPSEEEGREFAAIVYRALYQVCPEATGDIILRGQFYTGTESK